ncbi:MAG TPA: glycosyltransferase family 2 protein [Candidatus Paceibacterota bacterium]|nr:glycosyltransferase family 2 protein [Candidatus Paceibacterota bacterium]
MKPLITVIIPAHNNAQTIEAAVRSIADQTYDRLEILVIDDNSSDETRDVVLALAARDPRIAYHALPWDDPERVNKRGRNVNAGYMARNYGFEKAAGELITFQDADDVSFRNRIEVQYGLLKGHGATHVTVDWQRLEQRYTGKRFDAERFATEHPGMMGPRELARRAKRAKGIAFKVLPSIARRIDFETKRLRLVNKLFFGSLEAYPGTGNSPLFRREVVEKCRFRKLPDRVWPSFMGRGADRDFNFQVAETFSNSYVFFIPLYMWRQENQNSRYEGYNIETYII